MNKWGGGGGRVYKASFVQWLSRDGESNVCSDCRVWSASNIGNDCVQRVGVQRAQRAVVAPLQRLAAGAAVAAGACSWGP